MKSNHTQAAVELAEKIRCDDCFVVGGCDDNSTRLIKDALRTAHNAGLEEAAKWHEKSAETLNKCSKDTDARVFKNHYKQCAKEHKKHAKAIRAAASSLRDGEG